MGSIIDSFIDDRKNIISKSINLGFNEVNFDYNNLLFKVVGEIEYTRTIIQLLRHYRSSTELIEEEKNLVNQMIANKNYIPFFDISIDEINNKTIDIEVRKKSIISKAQRIQFAIDDEKHRTRNKLDDDLSILIEDAKKRINEVKEYIKIVTDKMMNDNE